MPFGRVRGYIRSQLGHASAAFTLDTYGHLMDRLPVQFEWIDELVFPEGAAAALKLPLYAAPPDAIAGHAVQRWERSELKEDAV